MLIRWYLVPAGAHLARDKRKPALVATANAHFAGPNTKTIKIKLTAIGKRRLKHTKHVRLTATATFAAPSRPVVHARRTFALKR
jgi:hypothetical protein